MASNPTPDEEVILRNRIIFDTRSLRKCYRRFLTQSVDHLSQSDLTTAYEQFLVDLRMVQTNLEKHQLAYEMYLRETAIYKDECNRIEREIDEAKADIITLKGDLEQAQLRRKNKLEYDDLAKQINKHSTRRDTLE
ncbi:THO complex subunit 7 [Rhizophlyctis rosea]|uniref:THO complex subunit 7 n=1 Tax=Rhizophlyctis rosea TaxID=64517 RepID=A0AAD5X6X6_9FUNG|nr:THO complex subunit 7 [Rhizophlyctis rosea]